MANNVSVFNQYMVLVVGVLLSAFGVFVLMGGLAVENLSLWLPAFLIIAGVIMLPGGLGSPTLIVIAFSLVCVGGFILLREMGVLTVPILRYAIGGSTLAIGIYGIVSSILNINKTAGMLRSK